MPLLLKQRPHRQAAIYRYRIPLQPSIRCAGADLAQREGLLLRLQHSDRRLRFGEAAPLPGFSLESLAQAQHDLLILAGDWLADRSLSVVPSPSARFGFSCALHELDHGPLSATPPVASYPLLQGDPASLLRQWQQHSPPEFSNAPSCARPDTVKLKLARQPLDDEIAQVQALLRHSPQLRLRIDCNRGWSLAQALRFVAEIPSTAIDYLEEPCFDLEQTLQLSAQSGVKFALDETLRQPEFASHRQQLPNHPGLTALVLKPSLTGAIDQLSHWIDLGQRRGLRTILSSSYESSLGLGQIAALAAKLTPDEPAGLDTAASFTANLLRQPSGRADAAKPTLPLEALTCLWHS